MKIRTHCKKCDSKSVTPVVYLKDVDALIVECDNCGYQGEIGEDELHEEDKKEFKKLRERSE